MKIENVPLNDSLTVSEVAAAKNVSKAAVYKAIKEDRLDYTEMKTLILIVINKKLSDFPKRKDGRHL